MPSDDDTTTATPLSAEFSQAFVDLGARTHIDALRGLVDEDDARFAGNFASDQHLLLVAAGKLRSPGVVVLLDAVPGVYAEPVHHFAGQGTVALPVDHAGGGNAIERADADVLAQLQGQKQTFFMAVVGDKPDAGAPRRRSGVALDSFALDAHRSRGAPFQSGDGAQELALTFALDAGHADDLAGTRGKADIREAGAREILDLEDGFARALRLVRKHLSERTARDHGDDLVGGNSRRRAAVDDLAVAQYGDVIGDLFDLAQPVRDVDDRDPFLAQPADELEKLDDVGLLERLRRLVEKQHLGFRRDRSGDLDDVKLRQRQVADPDVERHGVLF